ncbi:DUF1839 family protein [Methylobacterium radiotolerans]|uniref:Succinylarginine dihydrolase n=1 Tax=Methylobacterium radiotolerans (strain ATCC 27329 / DSM 1819 / JCM 2831 / NBRC 15690 / NCIMB 10815 / 0-1) TaxID=426355 RepID=B1M7B5_METRJ|nr:DUF1839 family protein [Methylobacterium radiotolerans]ACB22213.1 Domain of unknown function DUF1839 [Methylobacterium radiotolerans JCM 2831]GEM95653.1 hypothetical protein MRA01_01930 [Methylobacterium radiotolerans]
MTAALRLPVGLGAAGPHVPHPLHDSGRDWPETNCYVDLWIELLHGRGLVPEAMLGFTLRQDFEGDQFTFFKPPTGDIERLYGLEVLELAVYGGLENHAEIQAAAGRPVLVEVDAIYLPDTQGTTYGREHGKTTIGILALDPAARELDYLHNAGRFRLSGDDYGGIFGPATLPPYAEFVKTVAPPLGTAELPTVARELLVRHRARAPRRNPVLAFRDALAATAGDLVVRPLSVFHAYAFNTTRQLGANFEMLASHLTWLEDRKAGGFAPAAAAAADLSREAKAFQFQLARAFHRRSADGLAPRLDRLAATYDRVFADLDRALDR